ncbi:TetR/AcrR family transcriptional regulator [Eggerthella sinensis]|uniref:TetR/AcrR family transcriptional regulator n=1 Tax=Eggerthella sinensis TaxID=242230 RepID=UPI0022E72268|nr:TetR family transcriptional regulator [Eggerthella sinensis]
MGFKRARTDEQKRERLAGAVDAADRLLDRFPYREITMTSIADELGFSRANLGHYVRTKEELFLLLYLRDLTALHDELGALAGEDDGAPAGTARVPGTSMGASRRSPCGSPPPAGAIATSGAWGRCSPPSSRRTWTWSAWWRASAR